MQANGTHDAAAEVSRSFLFVPADSERKLDKAKTSGADALILDLEDSVAASARPKARALAAEFEQLSGALDYMRKVYMRPVVAPSPYAEVLRHLDLN